MTATKNIEFKISSYTPATIPQSRLGEYLIELAKLYGEKDSVRFVGLRKGSAVLVSHIDAPARPKVEKRLFAVRAGQAPRDAVEAFKRIDDMLALDNATGVLRNLDGNKVIPFPGKNRPKPVEYAAIREEGFIEGELVRIGGRDESVHLTLQDGDTVYSSIETTREMARQLGGLIFGPTLRLHGTGTWRRTAVEGWQLDRFVVARFEKMTDHDLASAIDDIRAIDGSEWGREEDPIARLLRDRFGGPNEERRKA